MGFCGLGEKSINKEEWNNEWTGWTGWEPLLLHILKNKNDDSASWLNWRIDEDLTTIKYLVPIKEKYII